MYSEIHQKRSTISTHSFFNSNDILHKIRQTIVPQVGHYANIAAVFNDAARWCLIPFRDTRNRWSAPNRHSWGTANLVQLKHDLETPGASSTFYKFSIFWIKIKSIKDTRSPGQLCSIFLLFRSKFSQFGNRKFKFQVI